MTMQHDVSDIKREIGEVRKALARIEDTLDRSLTTSMSREQTVVGSKPAGVSRYLLFAALAPPLLLLVWMIGANWVATPHMDQWDYEGTTLALYAEHRLTLSQLFAQHNESHLALARVIGLLSAPLTGWDMRYEVALTAGCAIFLAVGLNILICRTPSLSRLQVLSAVAVTDFAVLACTQFEVLLFGAYYFIMPSLTLVWALVLTGRPDRPTSATRLLIVYIAASIIATLSYINGIFHWFLLAPLAMASSGGKRAYSPRVIYGGIGFLVVLVYFATFTYPPYHPAPMPMSQLPAQLSFLFVWLGAPFCHIKPGSEIEIARAVGFVSVALFAAISTHILVSFRLAARSRAVHVWLILGSFVLLTGASITAGRGGWGLPAALPSRYHSFSLMFAPVVFVLMLIWGNLMSERLGKRRVRLIWPAVGLVASAGAILFALSSISGWADARVYGKQRRDAQLVVSLIDVIPDNPLLTRVYPHPDHIASIINRLRSLNLPNVILPADKILPALQTSTASLDGSRGFLDRVTPYDSTFLQVSGWAVTNSRTRPAHAVILVWRDTHGSVKPIAVLPVDGNRPDVAGALGNDGVLESGFSSYVYRTNIPGPGRITAWALYAKSPYVFPLAGAFDVP